MASNVGHTAKAVTQSGYFDDLDKAIGEKSATTAVSDFIAGKSNIDTLMSNLTTAAAKGERLDLASTALEQHLLTAGSYSTRDVKTILAQLTKIKTRTAEALKSAEISEQIAEASTTALMAKRGDALPKPATAQQTYVGVIRNATAKYKEAMKQKPPPTSSSIG